MKRFTLLTLLLVIFALTATPAFAQGGQAIVGRPVVVEATRPVEGNLLVIGGPVTVAPDGRVEGDLLVWGGEVDIAGRVAGDVMAWGGDVTLRSSAVVEGDVFLIGGQLHREEGAIIRGDVRDRAPLQELRLPALGIPPVSAPLPATAPGQLDDGSAFLSFLLNLIRIGFTAVGAAVIGLLVMIFLPEQTQTVKTMAVEQPIASMGVGLLTLIVVPPVMLLLIITICGIPIALVLGLALLMASLFGWIALGLMVGERLLSLLETEKPLPLVSVVVGVLLISVVTALPCLGWLLGLIGWAWGLGAVVLSRAGGRGPFPGGSQRLPAPNSEPSAA